MFDLENAGQDITIWLKYDSLLRLDDLQMYAKNAVSEFSHFRAVAKIVEF